MKPYESANNLKIYPTPEDPYNTFGGLGKKMLKDDQAIKAPELDPQVLGFAKPNPAAGNADYLRIPQPAPPVDQYNQPFQPMAITPPKTIEEYQQNHILSALGTPAPKLPETAFEFLKSTNNVSPIDFSSVPDVRASHLDAVHKLKGDAGEGIARISGQETADGLYGAIVKNNPSFNTNLTAPSRGLLESRLQRNPTEWAKYQEMINSENLAKQLQLTPAEISMRSRLTPNGQMMFDAKKDEERLMRLFPTVQQQYPQQPAPAAAATPVAQQPSPITAPVAPVQSQPQVAPAVQLTVAPTVALPTQAPTEDLRRRLIGSEGVYYDDQAAKWRNDPEGLAAAEAKYDSPELRKAIVARNAKKAENDDWVKNNPGKIEAHQKALLEDRKAAGARARMERESLTKQKAQEEEDRRTNDAANAEIESIRAMVASNEMTKAQGFAEVKAIRDNLIKQRAQRFSPEVTTVTLSDGSKVDMIMNAAGKWIQAKEKPKTRTEGIYETPAGWDVVDFAGKYKTYERGEYKYDPATKQLTKIYKDDTDDSNVYVPVAVTEAKNLVVKHAKELQKGDKSFGPEGWGPDREKIIADALVILEQNNATVKMYYPKTGETGYVTAGRVMAALHRGAIVEQIQ